MGWDTKIELKMSASYSSSSSTVGARRHASTRTAARQFLFLTSSVPDFLVRTSSTSRSYFVDVETSTSSASPRQSPRPSRQSAVAPQVTSSALASSPRPSAG
ncbi:hypothetical protein HAX54_050799, partial [Datura stramonium]|nr:hypothetical protein [Datura stramonium]